MLYLILYEMSSGISSTKRTGYMVHHLYLFSTVFNNYFLQMSYLI